MKVKELIEFLKNQNPEYEVKIEGLSNASNIDNDSGMFPIVFSSESLKTTMIDLREEQLVIGLDV